MKAFFINRIQSYLYISLLLSILSCKEEVIEDPKILPEACFTTEKDAYYLGTLTKFENCSKNATGYYWEFEPNFHSELENPEIIFNTLGIKNITLTVNDGKSFVSTEKTIEIYDYPGYEITPDNPDYSETPFYIKSVSDGGYIIQYNTHKVDQTQSINFIKKLDPNFQEQWKTVINSNYSTWGISYEEVQSGQLLNASSTENNSNLNIIAPPGDILSQTSISTLNTGIFNYIEKGDSIIYLGYEGISKSEHDIFFYITNNKGDFVDKLIFNFPSKSTTAVDLLKTSDGYLVLGQESDIGTNQGLNTQILLVKLDNKFNKIWDKSYTIPSNLLTSSDLYFRNWKIEFLSDGNYFLFTYPNVIKIDSNGSIIWTKNYDENSQSLPFGNEIRNQDQFLILNKNILTMIDLDGSIIWERTEGLGDFNYVGGIVEGDIFLLLRNTYEKVDVNGIGTLNADRINLVKMNINGDYVDF